MLYLEPPLHMIEGVSVFRDHSDPLQWYYLPLAPRLTTRVDPATGERVPQLQLIRFRGSAGNGGFLNFDVDLGIDADVLDEVQRQVKSREGLTDKPRLAPVPLVDGSVRMLLFDRDSGDVPDPDAPVDPDEEAQGFVLEIDHAAKPSLYGDNRAAFSVELSQRGVTILERALQGEMSPIGIVYGLDFLALRPAYNVRVHADWSRVQEHMEEHHSASIGSLFQSQIDDITDELIEEQVIEIEVDTFVPDSGDGSGLIARRDEAINDLRDMVTESFFEPSLEPMPREDGTEDDLRTAQRVIQMVATGGAGGSPMFSYSKLKAKRTDKKRFDASMRERTTVKRSIFPQGHLTGLFRALRSDGLDLERFIVTVDTDDPWFQRREVEVISRADFSADSIGSVAVRLDYGGEVRDVILDASTEVAKVDWASRMDGAAMRRPVEVSYRVTFSGVDTHERPLHLDSPPQQITGDKLEIAPRELYSIVKVPIVALGFPWERYSHVQVQVRYSDAVHGIAQDDDFLLDKDGTEAEWTMFVQDPSRTVFEYRLIHRGVDHKDIEGPWTESDDERLVVRDPFPSSLDISVVPVFDWSLVDRAFIDLRYEDRENGVRESSSIEFTQDDSSTKRFPVALQDPEHRVVNYRVTVISKDGSVTEIPPSTTREERIVVRGDMRGHRIVEIQSGPEDFEGLKLKDVVVNTRYVDPANGLEFNDQFTLRAPGQKAYFEYDYVDGGPAGFEYRVERRMESGLSRETDWIQAAENQIAISANA